LTHRIDKVVAFPEVLSALSVALDDPLVMTTFKPINHLDKRANLCLKLTMNMGATRRDLKACSETTKTHWIVKTYHLDKLGGNIHRHHHLSHYHDHVWHLEQAAGMELDQS
jgi:hypothetical protein